MIDNITKRHEEICKKKGFSSCLKEVETIEILQGDEVKILFEEYCDNCGKFLGKEIQTFKFTGIYEENV